MHILHYQLQCTCACTCKFACLQICIPYYTVELAYPQNTQKNNYYCILVCMCLYMCIVGGEFLSANNRLMSLYLDVKMNVLISLIYIYMYIVLYLNLL